MTMQYPIDPLSVPLNFAQVVRFAVTKFSQVCPPLNYQVQAKTRTILKSSRHVKRVFEKHTPHEASNDPSGLNFTAEIDLECPDIV